MRLYNIAIGSLWAALALHHNLTGSMCAALAIVAFELIMMRHECVKAEA